MKQQTQNKFSPQDTFTGYMKEMIEAKAPGKCKKLICDWTDKKTYLNHYRTLKIYVKHGLIVEKVHEVISCRRSERIELFINFNTQKRNETKYDLKMIFYEILNIAFNGKTMENVQNRSRIEFS